MEKLLVGSKLFKTKQLHSHVEITCEVKTKPQHLHVKITCNVKTQE